MQEALSVVHLRTEVTEVAVGDVKAVLVSGGCATSVTAVQVGINSCSCASGHQQLSEASSCRKHPAVGSIRLGGLVNGELPNDYQATSSSEPRMQPAGSIDSIK